MQYLKSIKEHLLLTGRKISLLFYILLCSWSTADHSTLSQLVSTKEYQVKAAFVFNFTQFIEWPEHSFTLSKSPFVIGIAGDDPFGEFLNDIVKNETVQGHPIVIQHYASLRDVKECHVLIVSSDQDRVVNAGMNSLNEKSTLTISDIPDFALKGGMIGFFLDNNKVRFRINLDRAKKANLTIDSKLLRLAQIVSDKGD